MDRVNKLFLLLTIIGPLHMAEQLMTSIEEFYSIQRLVGRYYAWFDPAAADSATVVLITVIWTVCSLMFYALLIGGTPKLAVLGVFGLFGAQEVHHVVESLNKRGYDAGVISCVPYAALGCLLVAAVWKELKGPTSHGAPPLDIPAEPLAGCQCLFGALRAPGTSMRSTTSTKFPQRGA
jgi:hypothetical protein